MLPGSCRGTVGSVALCQVSVVYVCVLNVQGQGVCSDTASHTKAGSHSGGEGAVGERWGWHASVCVSAVSTWNLSHTHHKQPMSASAAVARQRQSKSPWRTAGEINKWFFPPSWSGHRKRDEGRKCASERARESQRQRGRADREENYNEKEKCACLHEKGNREGWKDRINNRGMRVRKPEWVYDCMCERGRW